MAKKSILDSKVNFSDPAWPIAFIVAVAIISLVFLAYNASPNRLCFVEVEGSVQGLLDLNVDGQYSQVLDELRIHSVSGRVSGWIPCSKLEGGEVYG